MGYAWEDLKELKGLELVEVVAWFVAHGEEEDDLEWLEEDDELHVGGYWSDAHPVVEFEDGKVARWWRSEYWD
jgi:hypothetical protein